MCIRSIRIILRRTNRYRILYCEYVMYVHKFVRVMYTRNPFVGFRGVILRPSAVRCSTTDEHAHHETTAVLSISLVRQKRNKNIAKCVILSSYTHIDLFGQNVIPPDRPRARILQIKINNVDVVARANTRLAR